MQGGTRRNVSTNWFESQPREKRRAAHTSFIRAELSWATRFPRRCCDTVTALCRFTAHGDFMPSSSFRTTSDGTPRIVEVTGATVTVDRYAMPCCQHRHSTSLRSAGRTSASVPTLAEVAGFAEGS